jgi:hypothetical protein
VLDAAWPSSEKLKGFMNNIEVFRAMIESLELDFQ